MSNHVEQFAKSVIAQGLASSDQIKTFWNSLPAGSRPKNEADFAAQLVSGEMLTEFQAQSLLSRTQLALVLGDYVILDRIGAGGMGQVYRARHRRMDRVVAVKLLPPAFAQDADAIQRFHREVKAAAKLLHPNIVTAFDAGEARGQHYLVMEHVEGADLASMVARQGPLPVSLGVHYVRQAANGLAFAHARGVIHRDVKPANLLLSAEGVVKILDMGLARLNEAHSSSGDGLTQSGQVLGTVDFMAPEQAFDGKSVDARSDIYSLGCTLFRLLTGRSVYGGDSTLAKLLAHQNQPIPWLAHVRPDAPPELDSVFRRMVAKRPDERFASMADVLSALAEFDAEGSRGGMALASRVGPSSPSPTVSRPVPGGSTVPSFPAGSTGASRGSDHPTLSLAVGGSSATAAAKEARGEPSNSSAAPTSPPQPNAFPDVTLGASPVRLPARRRAERRVMAWVASGVTALLLAVGGAWYGLSRGVPEPAPTSVDRPGASADDANQETLPGAAKGGGSRAVTGSPTSRPASAGGWGPWTMPDGAPPPLVAPFSADAARAGQRAWADYLRQEAAPRNTLDMPFVLIPPGEFEFNLNPTSGGSVERTNVVRLRITQPYYIGAAEVSVAQFRRFVEETKHVTHAEQGGKVLIAPTFQLSTGRTWKTPVDWDARDEEPVVCIDVRDARAFADWLSVKEGVRYRLPSEAEWRFAARAGDVSEYGQSSWGVPYEACANWGRQLSAKRESPFDEVESLEPNPFGLRHVFGNVAEFSDDCRTHPSNFPYARQTETLFASVSSLGGHWSASTATPHPLDMRWRFDHDLSANYQGFRLVRELPDMSDLAPEHVGRLWIDDPKIAQLPAFVADPTPLRGLRSWTIDTSAGRFDPNHLHVTADERIHWVSGHDGGIRTFSPALEMERDAMPLGARGESFTNAWSRDGRWLATWQLNSGRVNVIDMLDGRQACNVVWVAPFAMSWSSDGTRLALVTDQELFVLERSPDRPTRLVRKSIAKTTSAKLSWAPGDKAIWRTESDGRMIVHRWPELDEQPVPDWFADQQVRQFAWSPNGKWIALRYLGTDSGVAVLDATTGDVQCEYRSDSSSAESKDAASSIFWNADSQSLYAAFGRELAEFTLRDSTLERKRVFEGELSLPLLGVDVGRDAQKFVYAQHGFPPIVLDRGRSRRMQILRSGTSPTLHPDQRRAFCESFGHFGIPAVAFDTDTGRQAGVLFPSLGAGRWLCIGSTGHYRGAEGVERDIVYVAEHLDGSYTSHTPAEFARKFGWKNDPNQATFLPLPATQ